MQVGLLGFIVRLLFCPGKNLMLVCLYEYFCLICSCVCICHGDAI